MHKKNEFKKFQEKENSFKEGSFPVTLQQSSANQQSKLDLRMNNLEHMKKELIPHKNRKVFAMSRLPKIEEHQKNISINKQIQKLITESNEPFKHVLEFSKQHISIQTIKQDLKNKELKVNDQKSTNLREKMLKSKSLAQIKFTNKFSNFLAKRFPEEEKFKFNFKLSFEVKFEDNFLKIKNIMTNQKTQVTIHALFDLFENYYNMFANFSKSLLKDQTNKFEELIELKKLTDDLTIKRFLYSSKKLLYPRVSKGYLINFMTKNYNCASIKEWISSEESQNSFIRSASKTQEGVQKEKPSIIKRRDYISSVKDQLESKLISVAVDDRKRISCFPNVKTIPQIQPEVFDFFKMLYFIYDKLVENFFSEKLEKIRFQIENSGIHKDNISSLIQDSKKFFEVANRNQRNLILKLREKIDISPNLFRVNFNLLDLESLLQNYGNYQSTNALLYRKFLKNGNKNGEN